MRKTHLLFVFLFLACFCLRSFSKDVSIYAPLLSTKGGRDAIATLARLEQGRTSGEAKLYSFLKSRDPLVRLRAVEVIGRNELSEGVPYLIDMLKDKDARVVKAAVFALGRLQDPSAVTPLQKLLSNAPLELQCGIAKALGGIGGEESMEVLKSMLQDFYSRLRGSAALALSRITSPQATSALLIAVHDPDPQVVWRVISALENHHGKRVENAIIPFLEHGDPLVRSYAARTLGSQKAASASLILIKSLEDGDDEVVVNSIYALGELREEKAVQPLGKILLKHPSHRVRIAAVSALQKIGGEKVKDYLIRACSDASTGVRVEAIKAISRIMGEKAEMYITMMLEDGSEVVREAARESMVIAGLEKAVEASESPTESPNRPNPSGVKTDDSLHPPVGNRKIVLKTKHGNALIELFGDDAVQTVGEFLGFENESAYGVVKKIIPHSMAIASISEEEGIDRIMLQPEINRHECGEGHLGLLNDTEQGGFSFFISYLLLPELDGRATIFGRVIEGMDAIKKMDYGEKIKLVEAD